MENKIRSKNNVSKAWQDYQREEKAAQMDYEFVLKTVLCAVGAFISAFVANYFLFVSTDNILTRSLIYFIFSLAFICFFTQPLREIYNLHLRGVNSLSSRSMGNKR